MSDTAQVTGLSRRVAIALGFLLVVVGMLNTMPEIPELQAWVRDLTGQEFLQISGFLILPT